MASNRLETRGHESLAPRVEPDPDRVQDSHSPRTGPARAMLETLDRGRGWTEIVVFADGDVVLDPDWPGWSRTSGHCRGTGRR